MRYIVEPHTPTGWHVRDTQFDGPGSVFDAPVKLVCDTREAASEAARRMNEDPPPSADMWHQVRHARDAKHSA